MEVKVKRSYIILFVIVIGLGLYYFLKAGSSASAVDEITKVRGPIGELVEEHEVSHGEVVFYLGKQTDSQQIVIADYVKKTFIGWKWSTGGGHSLPNYTGTDEKLKADAAWSMQYLPAPQGSLGGSSPFPLLFGAIDNADISSIVVKNLKTGSEQRAEIKPSQSSLRVWYAFVQGDRSDPYELTAITSTGKILSVKQTR
jgi:hypothetical protein